MPISTAAELPMPTFIGTALSSSRLKPYGSLTDSSLSSVKMLPPMYAAQLTSGLAWQSARTSRVAGQAVARLEVVERDARLDRQRPVPDLHRADAQRAVGARLQRHQHAAAQHGFADVRAGVVGDAAHDVEPRRHARDPDFAAVEEAGESGRIAVRLVQQLLERLHFERNPVTLHQPDCVTHAGRGPQMTAEEGRGSG